MNSWSISILNVLVLAGTPLGFYYGWRMYRAESRVEASRQLGISFIGLMGATVSIGLWVMVLLVARMLGLGTRHPLISVTIRLGEILPLLGAIVCFFGRRRLIIPIILASVGSSLFWWGTTLR
jgi:hypothetical protein